MIRPLKHRPLQAFLLVASALLIQANACEAQYEPSENRGGYVKALFKNFDTEQVAVQYIDKNGKPSGNPPKIQPGESFLVRAGAGSVYVIMKQGEPRKVVRLSRDESQTHYAIPDSWIESDDLFVTFTSKFQQLWHDGGSGRKGWSTAIWRPIPPAGFYPLGDYIKYENPNGNTVVAVVKEKKPGALTAPTKAAWVWTSGSPCDKEGRLYNLVAPPGYAALGSAGNGADPNYYRCVRKNLVIEAMTKAKLWDDHGTHWKTNISMWSIKPKNTPGEGFVALSSGSFVAHQSHGNPSRHQALYALKLPLQKPVDIKTTNTLPKLTKSRRPPETTGWREASVMRLPWFAVKDDRRTEAQRFEQSPLYKLRRQDRYRLISYLKKNDTQEPTKSRVDYSQGVSQSASNSFSQTTGISFTVGYTPPGETGGVHASVTMSHSFTQSWSLSRTRSETTTKSTELTARPGEAAALYQVESKCSLYRMDGEQVNEFDMKSYQVYATSSGG